MLLGGWCSLFVVCVVSLVAFAFCVVRSLFPMCCLGFGCCVSCLCFVVVCCCRLLFCVCCLSLNVCCSVYVVRCVFFVVARSLRIVR